MRDYNTRGVIYICDRCGFESSNKEKFNIFYVPIPGWGFKSRVDECKKCTEKIRRRADYLDALSLIMENYYKIYPKEA